MMRTLKDMRAVAAACCIGYPRVRLFGAREALKITLRRSHGSWQKCSWTSCKTRQVLFGFCVLRRFTA